MKKKKITINKEKEYLDGWKRAKAELINFKQHTEARSKQEREYIKRDVIIPLLTLADNFNALIDHTPDELKDDSWTQGVQHVAKQFQTILEEYGVTQIGKKEEAFDPNKHEAIEKTKKKGIKSGTITEVIQTGYKIGDTIIKPAKVKVTN